MYIIVPPFLLELCEQQSVTGDKARVAEQCIEQNQALMRECHRHREELRHLQALTRIKAEEREQKSRELLKAQVLYGAALLYVSNRRNGKKTAFRTRSNQKVAYIL